MKSYVAIGDPVHDLIRKITRSTPLTVRFGPSGQPLIVYDVAEEALPDSYYSLALLHSIGGMPAQCWQDTHWRPRKQDRTGVAERANFFDAVSLDKRCCRDLRLKPIAAGPSMLSAELLVFGTGMLRARNDDAGEGLYRYLWREQGRIQCPGEKVFARIRALHRKSRPTPEPLGKESFDSTNVVYGDALGELEQLWERRADIQFLDYVARSLRHLRTHGEMAAFIHPPLNLKSIVSLHLKSQSVWHTPPSGGRALLRRVERILDGIKLERRISTSYTNVPSQLTVRRAGDDANGWQNDQSGYDGWLAC